MREHMTPHELDEMTCAYCHGTGVYLADEISAMYPRGHWVGHYCTCLQGSILKNGHDDYFGRKRAGEETKRFGQGGRP